MWHPATIHKYKPKTITNQALCLNNESSFQISISHGWIRFSFVSLGNKETFGCFTDNLICIKQHTCLFSAHSSWTLAPQFPSQKKFPSLSPPSLLAVGFQQIMACKDWSILRWQCHIKLPSQALHIEQSQAEQATLFSISFCPGHEDHLVYILNQIHW